MEITKQIKVVTIVLLLLPIGNYAQHFVPGFKAGMVTSQVDGDRLDGYDKPSVTAGIFVENKFHEYWTFSMGIDYIQKGSRSIPNDSLGGRYYKLRLNYIEVPFLVRAIIKKKFQVEAGLVFGYLYRAREDMDAYGFTEPSPPFKKYDFPMRVGVGYSFNEHVGIRFHYSYSILPIRNHPANQTWYFDRGQYNNYLILSLYYTL